MNQWLRFFVVISLLFLAAALWRADYLRVPVIISYSHVVISVGMLCGGFLLAAVCWKKMLNTAGYRESLAGAVAGMGLSIFGKYIPGKVWAIAGRAAYTADQGNYPLGPISVVSVQTQLVELWVGLSVGTIGMWLARGYHIWGWLAASLWAALTLLIFSPVVHAIVGRVGEYSRGNKWILPYLNLGHIKAILPWFVLYWITWGAGFFVLARGLLGAGVAWQIGFGFPLAATLGIMAIVMPGGLGVREGVLTGYLMLCGVGVADATTVAVASRLWFLTGEAFLFVLGFVANFRLVGHSRI